jgi:hypothetical protein
LIGKVWPLLTATPARNEGDEIIDEEDLMLPAGGDFEMPTPRELPPATAFTAKP